MVMSCRTSSYFSSMDNAISFFSPLLQARHASLQFELFAEERHALLVRGVRLALLDLSHARLDRLTAQLARALPRVPMLLCPRPRRLGVFQRELRQQAPF